MKLKPCPFCLCEDLVQIQVGSDESERPARLRVRCLKCGAEGSPSDPFDPTNDYSRKGAGIVAGRRWNRRNGSKLG